MNSDLQNKPKKKGGKCHFLKAKVMQSVMNHISKIKKIAASALVAVMAFSFVACGAQPSNSTVEEFVPDFSKGLTDDGKYKDINILDYVTLPEGYLTMEVPGSQVKMSDYEWDAYYEQLIRDEGEKTEMSADKEIANGDRVSINFKGVIDDVAFAGGSAENVEFVVGSGVYLPEIEEGVLGHKKGDSFNVQVVFPEEYPTTTDEEGNEFIIAGKTANFTIDINSIFEQGLTDAKIAEVFKNDKALDGSAITTCEQLKKDFRARTEKSNLEAFLNDKLSKEVKISEIPQPIIDSFLEVELEVLKNSAQNTGFKSPEEFLKKNGFDSMDDYKSYIMEMHTEILEPQMALMAVAEANGIKADHSLCDIVFGSPYEELIDKFGKGYVNQNLVLYQALELLCEGAVVVEDTTEENSVSENTEANDIAIEEPSDSSAATDEVADDGTSGSEENVASTENEE